MDTQELVALQMGCVDPNCKANLPKRIGIHSWWCKHWLPWMLRSKDTPPLEGPGEVGLKTVYSTKKGDSLCNTH